MILIWILVFGLQLRLGKTYPEGRPDCSVLGQWLDYEGNRSITVSEVKPGLVDYLKLHPEGKHELQYQNNWDIHKGAVNLRSNNFLVAGLVPSVEKPDHQLFLMVACYQRELWVLSIPYMNGDYHGSAFFKMTPVVNRVSDDLELRPLSNDTQG